MKKLLLFALVSLFTISTQAQQKTNWDYVKDVKPITWTKEVKTTNTIHIEGNKTSSTIAGGAIGHILFKRSLLGTIGGALVGNAMGSSDDNQTTTTVTYVTVTGYQITTGDGYVFKTFDYYPKWKLLDFNKVKKE